MHRGIQQAYEISLLVQSYHDFAEFPAPPEEKTGWPWTEVSVEHPFDPGVALPKITVVTPSYNQGMYIEETIRAILLQRYPNLEYIISEDGSTDDSLAIIERYAPWLRVLRADKNSGMSAAINKGFAEATGDIITWISSDDTYQPGAFHEVARKWMKLDTEKYGVIVGGFSFMNENSDVEEFLHKPRIPGTGPIDLSLLPLSNWRLHQVSTFYLRTALDNAGRFVREEIRHNMDRELLYRICKSYKICTTDMRLAAFRIHRASKSWNPKTMISMARDFAAVQNYFRSDVDSENRIREKIARQIIGSGYVKYAKYNTSFWKSVVALLTALWYHPKFLFKKNYLKNFITVAIMRPFKWEKINSQ